MTSKTRRMAGVVLTLMVAGCGPWFSQGPQPWTYEGVSATFKVRQGWMTFTAAPKNALPGPLPGEGALKPTVNLPLRYESVDAFDGRQAVFMFGNPSYLLQAKALCTISTFATDKALDGIITADLVTIRGQSANRVTDESYDLPPVFPLRSFTYAHRAAVCNGSATVPTASPTPASFRPWLVSGIPDWCDLVVTRYYWAKSGRVHVMEIDHLPGVLDSTDVRTIAEGFVPQ